MSRASALPVVLGFLVVLLLGCAIALAAMLRSARTELARKEESMLELEFAYSRLKLDLHEAQDVRKKLEEKCRFLQLRLRDVRDP